MGNGESNKEQRAKKKQLTAGSNYLSPQCSLFSTSYLLDLLLLGSLAALVLVAFIAPSLPDFQIEVRAMVHSLGIAVYKF